MPKKSTGTLMVIPFLVYFGTFATANIYDSVHAATNSIDPLSVPSTPSKYLATTAVNTGLCVYKDGLCARLATKMPVPAMSYGMFLARDAAALLTSYNLPSLLQPISEGASSSTPAPSCWLSVMEAQMGHMAAPAMAQIVSTPLHLLGLDLHKRQQRVSIRERICKATAHMSFATPLRMLRVIPSYGIGIGVNNSCRSWMLS
ncbi:hypothetical protein HJFPF1_07544 [Paramyrothecium foliicola]|nr:hypothetical protein HJFPF1_07544 [Paramyrothecium foliicola]